MGCKVDNKVAIAHKTFVFEKGVISFFLKMKENTLHNKHDFWTTDLKINKVRNTQIHISCNMLMTK